MAVPRSCQIRCWYSGFGSCRSLSQIRCWYSGFQSCWSCKTSTCRCSYIWFPSSSFLVDSFSFSSILRPIFLLKTVSADMATLCADMATLLVQTWQHFGLLTDMHLVFEAMLMQRLQVQANRSYHVITILPSRLLVDVRVCMYGCRNAHLLRIQSCLFVSFSAPVFDINLTM